MRPLQRKEHSALQRKCCTVQTSALTDIS